MNRGTGDAHEAGGSIWSRRVVLKGAGLAGAVGAAGIAGQLLRSAGAGAATGSAGSVSAAGALTVSYTPVHNAGYPMWIHYDGNGPQYQADMATAKSLGFNTVRIFLAAKSGVFDFPSPTKAELGKLTNLGDRAKEVGVKLHINLFDFWSMFGHIAQSKEWATAILGAVPDVASLAAQIEVKNEVKFASTGAYVDGFDSGWPAGQPKKDVTIGHAAIVWAQEMIPYIRTLVPGVPITISTTTDNRYFPGNPVADLEAFVKAVKHTKAAPDWYNQHIYTGTTPGLIYHYLQQAVSAVKGSGRSLIVGETGCTSAASGTQGLLQAQQQEADFLHACRWYCAQAGIPDPAPWILFDLEPSEQFTSGNTFGLYNTSHKIKLAGKMYEAIPPGTTVPAIPINGTMRGGNQPDTNGNALPPRWYLYKGDKNNQPITSAIDTVDTFKGNPSIALSKYEGTRTGETAPALMTNPITAPLTVPGRTYAWTAYLKASGSYGQVALAVSWYGENSANLGSTTGAPLKLTGSFAQHSLKSTAPAGALYAKLAVTVRNDTNKAGSVWVANATWALST
jgi:hypothetical protein